MLFSLPTVLLTSWLPPFPLVLTLFPCPRISLCLVALLTFYHLCSSDLFLQSSSSSSSADPVSSSKQNKQNKQINPFSPSLSFFQVLDDGSVSDTFSHKSQFPEDMDPLTISGTLNPDGTLLVSVRRTAALFCPEPLCVPTYYNETHFWPISSYRLPWNLSYNCNVIQK